MPALKSYKGYLAPLAWILSYLWLTAFIFASQDYDYNGGCAVNSPRFVNKCNLKRTLEAFAFITLYVGPGSCVYCLRCADSCCSFTSLVGTLLEARLWDVQRFKGTNAAGVEKDHGVGAAPAADAPAAAHQTV